MANSNIVIFKISLSISIPIFSKNAYLYFVDIDILTKFIDILSIFQKMPIYRQSISIFHRKSMKKVLNLLKNRFFYPKCPYWYRYQYFENSPYRYWYRYFQDSPYQYRYFSKVSIERQSIFHIDISNRARVNHHLHSNLKKKNYVYWQKCSKSQKVAAQTYIL